ncbi:MAG: GlsB/YeaQ/YmgE family stress response membrane protein [Burkholderiales bacterium]
MEFLWLILIGLAAGWLASQFWRGGRFGVVGGIAAGMVGALVVGFLFRQLSLPGGGGLIGALIVATIGAVILLFLVRVVKRA